MSELSTNESHTEGARIGDCYRVEAELGHGGMARVYRVLDERSGERFALKKLVATGDDRTTLQAMFEREFHALVQLAHPRIVRVFDYGLDADDPYYTMELLKGADLRGAARSAPLPVHEVCLLLRDAASALALIHSRRLVHRDIGPRNLWRTSEGRGKLIDFGTLVAMGPQTRAAGTAPFVPPEAAYGQPLDARCDLYALGALAYFLLTQRDAYPARDFSDLRQHWRRRPARPDAINPELPRALCDLVMALLSLDARGRPASAAEVVDRLNALAPLPPEDERPLAQAFLTSPTLVGRSACSEAVRKALLRARRGHCTSLAFVAPAGMGRSRMLASSVLEAKLMGAAVVSLDADATGATGFALATALAERLVEVVPLAAAAAGEAAAALGYVSRALHRALGEPALPELREVERVHKVTAAFIALAAAASRQHHVMIAVDDVQRADGPSLGVLAQLRAMPGAQRLLMLTTCDEAALLAPSPLLEQLVQPQDRVDLAPLGAAETRALLGSLFGEVAALDDAAHWLHELSRGSPQTCMQYAQYLVDHGLARYAGGQWRFPDRLRDQALPPTLGAMLEARLAEWSEDARALALGLALARDDSRAIWQPEYHVNIEDYPQLIDDAVAGRDARATSSAARAFAALDELVRAGMLRQHDAAYVLGQRAMVDALLSITDEEDLRHMHRRLARIFEREGYRKRMAVVRHLQCAGEHVAARKLLNALNEHTSGGGVMDWGAMRVSVSAECTVIALEHWQRHGGSPREGILLRRLLLQTCSGYDWRLAVHGDAQVAQLHADIGLDHWDATDHTLSTQERARECMRRAQALFDATPESERGFAPQDALRELAAAMLTLYGAFMNCHDVAGARRVPPLLERLRGVSSLIDVVADMSATGVERVRGADVGNRMLGHVQALVASSGLPDVLQHGGAGMMLYAQALEDSRRGRARALPLVDLMVSRVGEEMFLVAHPRWLCHAFRGRADKAAPYRRQVELITEDDIWRRKSSLFVEAELYDLLGDLAGLQRTSEAIGAIAADFPGWRPWLLWTRGVMHRLRGELAAAQAELEAALALAPAGEHRAWVRAAPALAEVLLQRGDLDGALRLASAIIEATDTRALDPMAGVAAERVRALIELKRGDQAAARTGIERAFIRAELLGCDGLPLAVLYEAHARILLACGKPRECAAALTELRELIEHADAPPLIQAYESLRAENAQLAWPELPLSIAPPTRHAIAALSQHITELQLRLGAHDERAERAREALAILLEDSGARDGYLFLFNDSGLFVAASSGAATSGEQLLPLAQKHLDAEISKSRSDAVTVVGAPTVTRPSSAAADSELVPVLLASDDSDGGSVVTGLALLAGAGATRRLPRIDLVRAISRCLELAGDSVAVPLEA